MCPGTFQPDWQEVSLISVFLENSLSFPSLMKGRLDLSLRQTSSTPRLQQQSRSRQNQSSSPQITRRLPQKTRHQSQTSRRQEARSSLPPQSTRRHAHCPRSRQSPWRPNSHRQLLEEDREPRDIPRHSLDHRKRRTLHCPRSTHPTFPRPSPRPLPSHFMGKPPVYDRAALALRSPYKP